MSEPTVALTGRIENWYVDVYGFPVLWGDVYEDTKGRFKDGTHIHTSQITEKQVGELTEGYVLVTLNSVYLLGKSLADHAFEQEEAEYVGEGQ